MSTEDPPYPPGTLIQRTRFETNQAMEAQSVACNHLQRQSLWGLISPNTFFGVPFYPRQLKPFR